ncbi:MAG: heparinase II/III family protein, partial [Acidobacteriota bacterium]
GWLYGFLKQNDTLEDVIYRTEEAPQKSPSDENPVRVFRDTGTTVFRSGWEKDDFVFVLRTGAFYNHQHLDQGTFWLADRGNVFIGERQGSTYYDDPLYQSHYTQPIAHSTILIDHNGQSQRVGDALLFIEGLDDRAFIHHFLDGRAASFVSGDIGRLYWGKVRELRRNVLYLKPRTVLMLDTIVPAAQDVDVTLLYQASALKDIQADQSLSRIRKQKATLRVHHLWPREIEVKAEETPLYINSLRTENPLIKEGMLVVTSRTAGKPLVMAQLLTTLDGARINHESADSKGFISGKIEEHEFLFSTNPGQVCGSDGWTTDALALTWSGATVFAALATTLDRDGKPILRSTEPITYEISGPQIKYCLAEPAEVSLFLDEKPRAVSLDGKKTKEFSFDSKERRLKIMLAAGEGTIFFELRD